MRSTPVIVQVAIIYYGVFGALIELPNFTFMGFIKFERFFPGVVALGMKMNYVDSIKLKIEMLCKKVSIENQLPFTLSISLGAVDLQKSSVLKQLLAEEGYRL